MLPQNACRSESYLCGDLLDREAGCLQEPLGTTHAAATHCPGVVPTCSRNRRLKVLVLIAARRVIMGNESSLLRLCSIQINSGAMAVLSAMAGGL